MPVTDYSEIIDQETWGFIERSQAIYPPDAVTWSIAKNRQVYDGMARVFHTGRPAGMITEDRLIGRIPVRIYEQGDAAATVVYLHGGGFILGGLESHDDVCADIWARTGYRVMSVDYRLAPEFKHPAAFDDAFQATQWAAHTWRQPLVLAGDSAGGNLAAAVVHATRGDITDIAGQVLIYPALGGDVNAGSYLRHANAPMLTRAEILYYEDMRFAGARPASDPTVSQLQDSDFTNLPPTVIVTAQCDPLSDDGRHYRDKITAAGGQAVWFEEAGLVHGYLRARTTVRRAKESFDRIACAIEALGQAEWPY